MRVNPLFPIPGFDNEKVLVPFSSAYEVNFQPSFEPPTQPIIGAAKPIQTKKRKPKCTPIINDLESPSSKKPRPIIIPSLRLSNFQGGRRGGRGDKGKWSRKVY